MSGWRWGNVNVNGDIAFIRPLSNDSPTNNWKPDKRNEFEGSVHADDELSPDQHSSQTISRQGPPFLTSINRAGESPCAKIVTADLGTENHQATLSMAANLTTPVSAATSQDGGLLPGPSERCIRGHESLAAAAPAARKAAAGKTAPQGDGDNMVTWCRIPRSQLALSRNGKTAAQPEGDGDDKVTWLNSPRSQLISPRRRGPSSDGGGSDEWSRIAVFAELVFAMDCLLDRGHCQRRERGSDDETGAREGALYIHSLFTLLFS
jgi:hypothetical protein